MKILLTIVVVAVLCFVLWSPLRNFYLQRDPATISKAEVSILGNLSVDNRRIMEIQQVLRQLGHYFGTMDGRMSKDVRDAVKKFQASRGLPPTGIVDRSTFNGLIHSAIVRDRPVPKTVSKASKTDYQNSYDVRTIQSLLREAGFYKGKIDGKMGPRTVQAIKQFQRSRNIKDSGVINANTIQAFQRFRKEGGI